MQKSEKYIISNEGKFSSLNRERRSNVAFVFLSVLILLTSVLFIFISYANSGEKLDYKPYVQGQTVLAFTQNSNSSETIQKININTASLKKLCEIKYVGESRAEKIIAYRTANNGFKSIEEIKNISGIGDKFYEEIKDTICV